MKINVAKLNTIVQYIFILIINWNEHGSAIRNERAQKHLY